MVDVDSSSSSDALATDRMLSLVFLPGCLANVSTADSCVRPPTTGVVAEKLHDDSCGLQ